MANVNAPKGFSPIRNGSSNPWNQSVNMYVIKAADTNAFYLGDAVISAANADANGVPAVTRATVGTETVRGVIVGIRPIAEGVSLVGTTTQLEQISLASGAKAHDWYVYVIDDPDCLFEIQADADAGGKVIAANMNKNASFTVGAPGTSTFPLSGTVLTSASIAVTQGLNLRLIGLVQDIQNTFGAYARIVVKFNQHELMGNTAGI
jgi:hypothetical protein